MTPNPKVKMHLFKSVSPKPTDLFFVYKKNELLMVDGRLPSFEELQIKSSPSLIIFELKNGWAISGRELPSVKSGMFLPLRDTLDALPSPLVEDVTLAAHYVNWSEETKYCSVSGRLLEPDTKNLLKFCHESKRRYYPKVLPVVIVLIRRGDELLLAKGLPPKKHYSCLAGFVEPGESVEDALRREVKEEAGIEIKNLKYMASQPWPFPNNLMLGYTADWAAGEIAMSRDELTDIGWFSPENLPEVLPPKASIARKMIDRTLMLIKQQR